MAVGMNRRMLRRKLPNAPQTVGGAVGVGAPVVLRETADVRDGQAVTLLGEPSSALGRLTSPSAAWGLGVGALTGALWWMDAGGQALQDFYLAHTATGIPTGVASALLPKAGEVGATEQSRVQSMLASRASSPTPAPGSQHDGEFEPSGGSSSETQAAQ